MTPKFNPSPAHFGTIGFRFTGTNGKVYIRHSADVFVYYPDDAAADKKDFADGVSIKSAEVAKFYNGHPIPPMATPGLSAAPIREQLNREVVEQAKRQREKEQAAAQAKQVIEQQLNAPLVATDQSASERKLITAADLLSRRVESIPCLIEPILQAVGLAAVAGSSDVGKSAFLRQLAFAVATGQSSFLGWPIRANHQAAIYVSSEDDENATAFLLNSLNKTKRHDEADCHRLRFIFETHNLLNELDYHLTDTPADLVVIDAFGDLYSGDANKTNQIRQFLHDYSQLAQKHGCLILWLHHTGKHTDEEAPSKHHVIGGQGFEGKMRLLIELRRDHQNPTIRHLCIVKGNYLPDDYKNDSYALRFANFVFEQTGERVPFEQLAKSKTVEGEGAKYKRAIELQHEGYTLEQIAQELGYSNKGGVSKLLKRNAPVSS